MGALLVTGEGGGLGQPLRCFGYVQGKRPRGCPGAAIDMTYPPLFASCFVAGRREGRVSFGEAASHKLQPLKVQLVASFWVENKKSLRGPVSLG